jgi:hypothetical protein
MSLGDQGRIYEIQDQVPNYENPEGGTGNVLRIKLLKPTSPTFKVHRYVAMRQPLGV